MTPAKGALMFGRSRDGGVALLGRLEHRGQPQGRVLGQVAGFGNDQLLGDGTALRADFIGRFSAAREALEARFDAAGIRHATYVLDEEVDAPLRRLFGRRVD